MNGNAFLIDSDVYFEIEEVEYIKEYIDDHDEVMKAIIKKKSTGKLYRIFDTERELSQMHFLSNKKFPDGLFISFNEDQTVTCYICELKRTPSNLTHLTLQLFSGYMHCRLLLSALHVDLEKVTFTYHVFMLKDYVLESRYNRIPGISRKVTPGREVIPNEIFVNWERGIVKLEEGDFCFEEEVNKHIMDEMDGQNQLKSYVSKLVV